MQKYSWFLCIDLTSCNFAKFTYFSSFFVDSIGLSTPSADWQFYFFQIISSFAYLLNANIFYVVTTSEILPSSIPSCYHLGRSHYDIISYLFFKSLNGKCLYYQTYFSHICLACGYENLSLENTGFILFKAISFMVPKYHHLHEALTYVSLHIGIFPFLLITDIFSSSWLILVQSSPKIIDWGEH